MKCTCESTHSDRLSLGPPPSGEGLNTPTLSADSLQLARAWSYRPENKPPEPGATLHVHLHQSRVLKLGGDKISTRALVLGTNSTTGEETQINNSCKNTSADKTPHSRFFPDPLRIMNPAYGLRVRRKPEFQKVTEAFFPFRAWSGVRTAAAPDESSRSALPIGAGPVSSWIETPSAVRE